MQFVAHYFEHLSDTLRSLYSTEVAGETIEEARAAAISLLPTVSGALGFRVCDSGDRQLDIYVPPDLIIGAAASRQHTSPPR